MISNESDVSIALERTYLLPGAIEISGSKCDGTVSGKKVLNMSVLSPVLAFTALSVCLLHTVPGAVAGDPSLSECGTRPADIVFLLDTSTSVGNDSFKKVKDFVKHFIETFKIGPDGVNVGVVTFSYAVHDEFWLSNYTSKNPLLEAVDRIAYHGGSTRTYFGLHYIRDTAFTKAHGNRDDAVDILIVITDGQSSKKAVTVHEADMIHRTKTNLSVLVVGIGDSVDKEELERIAGTPENVFNVTDFASLETLQDKFQISTCEAIAATSPSFNSSATAAPVDECGTLPGDIVFLLDSSGSVGNASFKKVKDFMKHVAESFKIGPDEVNIGVVTLDTQIHDEFWLCNFTSESSLLDAIDKIQYYAGVTQTHEALAYARQHAFSKAQGDRDGAANILIVLTDGQSDNPNKTLQQAEKLHKTNTSILVIGVGEFIDDSELEIIANRKENVFHVIDFSALDTVKDKLKIAACKAIAAAPSDSSGAAATAPPGSTRDNEK